MPFDTVLWGEVAAKTGLTGTVFCAGQNHVADGDKCVLKTEPFPPFLHGLGSLSDTKPAGCALVPDEQNAQLPIQGPGALDFGGNGWLHALAKAPIELMKGDKLTGQCSSTAVNEGSIIGAHIVYGKILPLFDLVAISKKYEKLFTDIVTITSGADVTFNSGVGSLDSLVGNYEKWSDPDGKFEILGTITSISAATLGGIANILNLGGDWKGHQPGIIVNPLSAVTFNGGRAFNEALEPIPFNGDSLPTVGMTATTAGAITFGFLIGKLPT